MKNHGLVATRRSLVERLADWGDQLWWQEFFETYWKLIYSAARQSGLTDTEAQDEVVGKNNHNTQRKEHTRNTIRQLVRSEAGCYRSRAGESPTSFANASPPMRNALLCPMAARRQQSSVSPIRAALIWMPSGKRSGRRIYLR